MHGRHITFFSGSLPTNSMTGFLPPPPLPPPVTTVAGGGGGAEGGREQAQWEHKRSACNTHTPFFLWTGREKIDTRGRRQILRGKKKEEDDEQQHERSFFAAAAAAYARCYSRRLEKAKKKNAAIPITTKGIYTSPSPKCKWLSLSLSAGKTFHHHPFSLHYTHIP